MNMSHLTLRSLAVLGASFFALSTAQALVLDFEGFPAGTIIDDEYEGITISATTNSGGSPNVAVVFDTENPTGGDNDLAAPFRASSGSDFVESFFPGNVLILQENDNCGSLLCDVPDDDANGGTFFIQWDAPRILNSIDFFDIEANEAGAPITITLATTNGILPSFTVPETGGDNTWGRLDFGGIADVIGLTVNLNGSGAIDNINFAIPLPGVAWMFFPGLAVLAARVRRRKAV